MVHNARVFAPRASALLVLAICALGRPAQAQESASARPTAGLFGGDSISSEQLSFSWSLLGAADDNVTTGSVSASDPRFQVKGTYGTADGSLSYSTRGKHALFSATAASGGRYYPDLKELSGFDGSGGVSLAADLGAKTSIQASQGFTYQPYYQLNFLNVLAPATSSIPTRDSDAALTTRESIGFVGNFGLTRHFTARSSFTVGYSYRRTQFSASSERFLWQIAHAKFSHNLTRYAALRLGYGYGQGQNGIGVTKPTVNHDLDIGVDYSRALSFSRKTTLTFGSGTTIIRQQDVSGQNGSYYRANGDANLTREIGRTWSAVATYHRGVQFIEGFADPLYADSVLLHVGGLLNRRVSVSLSGDYSKGTLGVGTVDHGYSTSSAGSEVRVALNRTLAAYAQYFYYRYGFDNGVALPGGLPSALGRQGLRVGISGWLPLHRGKESGK